MTRIKRICFVAFAALMLVAPAVNRYLVRDVPGSFLEGRPRPDFPAITWSAVAEEKAQSAFDDAIAFGVPNRDETMLAHARRQRRLIGLAARLFGFSAWPTYYGSKFSRIARGDAVSEMPRKAGADDRELMEDAARRYAEAMSAHPELRWFFALVDTAPFSLAGPLHDYVGDPVDYGWFRKHFFPHLPKSCTVIDLGYETGEVDAFNRDYFRTDHHWRIQGALRAYGRIAASLGIAPIAFEPPAPATAPEFYGSQSRDGLDADLPGDAIYDVAYARSPLQVEFNGIQVPDWYLDYGYRGEPYKKKIKFEDMYGGYFHGWGHLRLVNERAPGGSLLIVGGSQAQCFERFFAESYREVHVMDPRFTPFTLSKLLTIFPVDDVLFLFSPSMAAYEEFQQFFR